MVKPHSYQLVRYVIQVRSTTWHSIGNGRFIAAAGDDHTVKVWDVKSRSLLVALRGHSRPVACVSFSPDGHKIISASYDGDIKLWDTANKSGCHHL